MERYVRGGTGKGGGQKGEE